MRLFTIKNKSDVSAALFLTLAILAPAIISTNYCFSLLDEKHKNQTKKNKF
tara:strand:+ start:15638 stop:15790 length:153 start_codon:yes stop_codon:yes gene_type:complete